MLPLSPTPPFCDLPTPCSPRLAPSPTPRHLCITCLSSLRAGSGTCRELRKEGKLQSGARQIGCPGCTTSSRRRRNYLAHRNPILRVLCHCRFCCRQPASARVRTPQRWYRGSGGSREDDTRGALALCGSLNQHLLAPTILPQTLKRRDHDLETQRGSPLLQCLRAPVTR